MPEQTPLEHHHEACVGLPGAEIQALLLEAPKRHRIELIEYQQARRPRPPRRSPAEPGSAVISFAVENSRRRRHNSETPESRSWAARCRMSWTAYPPRPRICTTLTAISCACSRWSSGEDRSAYRYQSSSPPHRRGGRRHRKRGMPSIFASSPPIRTRGWCRSSTPTGRRAEAARAGLGLGIAIHGTSSGAR